MRPFPAFFPILKEPRREGRAGVGVPAGPHPSLLPSLGGTGNVLCLCTRHSQSDFSPRRTQTQYMPSRRPLGIHYVCSPQGSAQGSTSAANFIPSVIYYSEQVCCLCFATLCLHRSTRWQFAACLVFWFFTET